MSINVIHFFRAYWKPVTALAAFVLLVVWTSGALRERVAPGVVETLPGEPLPADAQTVTVEMQTLPVRVAVVGSMVSDNTVHISARIQAHVRDIPVSAGDSVTNGQLLVRLDDREQQARVVAARAALHRAQTEYDRIKQLFDAQATTEQNLIAMESARRIAESQLNEAEVALTFTEIRAPMDGRVTDRQVESGMLARAGQILLSVYDPTRMRLDAPVPVRLVDYLRLGDALDVELERPSTILKGRVHRVVSEIDPTTRTQTVQILVETTGLPILPGTFGRVAIPSAPRDMVLIPAAAIRSVGQLHVVNVVEHNRVIRRLVTPGITQDGYTEILSGLQHGDVLLIPGDPA